MIRQIMQLADSSRGPVKLALALLFALLVLAVYALVWSTGGIKYVWSHTMYLVIIAAALLLGVRSGVIRDVATVLRETDAEPSAVAEGIKDRETESLLNEMTCDAGQGFHFSRPLSLDRLRDFVGQKAA